MYLASTVLARAVLIWQHLAMHDPHEVTVTRQQTAREEIDLAIHLLMTDGSLICANLLAWAAVDMMKGVAAREGKTMMADWMADRIIPDRKKEWFGLLKEHYNFAKHADRDPDKTVNLGPSIVEWVIFEGVADYGELYRMSTFPMFLHKVYMFARNPIMVNEMGQDNLRYARALFGDSPELKDVKRFYRTYLSDKKAIRQSIPAGAADWLQWD